MFSRGTKPLETLQFLSSLGMLAALESITLSRIQLEGRKRKMLVVSSRGLLHDPGVVVVEHEVWPTGDIEATPLVIF